MYYDLYFGVSMGFLYVCVNMCISSSICVACIISLAVFPVWLFFSYFNLFWIYVILFCYHSSDVCLCLFTNRNKKGMDTDRRGGREELEVVEGGETIITIYCMKKIYFQYKKKVLSVGRTSIS